MSHGHTRHTHKVHPKFGSWHGMSNTVLPGIYYSCCAACLQSPALSTASQRRTSVGDRRGRLMEVVPSRWWICTSPSRAHEIMRSMQASFFIRPDLVPCRVQLRDATVFLEEVSYGLKLRIILPRWWNSTTLHKKQIPTANLIICQRSLSYVSGIASMQRTIQIGSICILSSALTDTCGQTLVVPPKYLKASLSKCLRTFIA